MLGNDVPDDWGSAPYSDHDVRRIQSKKIAPSLNAYEDAEYDEFYVPVSEEDREEKAKDITQADRLELQKRLSESLLKGRANGVYRRVFEPTCDWFRNTIPKNPEEWESSHPMAFEIKACVEPIIISEMVIQCEWLKCQMEKCGGSLMRVAGADDPSLWTLVFVLDSRFYANVIMCGRSTGVPAPVATMIEREKVEVARRAAEWRSIDTSTRERVLETAAERKANAGRGGNGNTEEEDEDDLLDKEEEDALRKNFEFGASEGVVLAYKVYLFERE